MYLAENHGPVQSTRRLVYPSLHLFNLADLIDLAGKSPAFSLYQRDVFVNGTKGTVCSADLPSSIELRLVQLPPCSSDPITLQQQAEKKFTEGGYWYATSNAGVGWTDAANRQAFWQWRIKPRMLVDTNSRDMTVTLFGRTLSSPLIFAPVGLNKIYHPQGELIPASVAQELGMGYCLSTAATQTIEDVAKANGDGVRWFQLYMGHDDDVVRLSHLWRDNPLNCAQTRSLLTRAHKSGFEVCILTLDTCVLPSVADSLSSLLAQLAIGISTHRYR